MKVVNPGVDEVKIIELDVFRDHRGFFMETYNSKVFKEAGITADFIQYNHSYSKEKEP